MDNMKSFSIEGELPLLRHTDNIDELPALPEEGPDAQSALSSEEAFPYDSSSLLSRLTRETGEQNVRVKVVGTRCSIVGRVREENVATIRQIIQELGIDIAEER